MQIKQNISLLLIFLLIAVSIHANAHDDTDKYYIEYKQKLILLQGKKSRLMDGDVRPAFNFNKKEALPYYLARGWTIQHIYFDENSTQNSMYGYAVIEKREKVKKRFSHRH
jgi:hypothetical protein